MRMPCSRESTHSRMNRMNSDIAKRILFEDNHLIVIDKRPGELVQADKTGDATLADSLKEYLRAKYNKQGNVFLGIPHRLDRPTSGIVIFAKTEKALVRMNALFKSGDGVRKWYWAVVDRLPTFTNPLIIHHLVRDAAKNKSFAFATARRNSKEARLNLEIIGASKSYYLLEIELLTGRHHQIRAQLHALGSHIKGDVKYGAARTNIDGSIHLHARRVEFMHPVKKELVVITCRPPKDPVWDFFATLE